MLSISEMGKIATFRRMYHEVLNQMMLWHLKAPINKHCINEKRTTSYTYHESEPILSMKFYVHYNWENIISKQRYKVIFP